MYCRDYTIREPSIGSTVGLGLNPSHQKYFKDRAVPLEMARAVGICSVDSVTGARLLGGGVYLDSAGIWVPYPNINPLYGRMRLDTGAWIAPQGRPVPVYLTFDPSHAVDTLYVVEGPVKALALAAIGLAAIGLGGVATTLTDKHGTRALNDSWPNVTGKKVTVCFDANRCTNIDVAKAEARLALALELSGADVRLASIPLDAQGRDQGPDDYIAANGKDAFVKLIGASVPANPKHRIQQSIGEEAELLGDIPFIISVTERDPSCEHQVTSILKKSGIPQSGWNKAKRWVSDLISKRRKEEAKTELSFPDLAHEYLAQAGYKRDGVYLLRGHQGLYYGFNGRCYQEVAEEDLSTDIMRFVQNHAATKHRATNTTLTNLKKNISALFHTTSKVELPAWYRSPPKPHGTS